MWPVHAQVFARGQDEQQRGLTPGFLEGPRHQRLVRGRAPRHRGVLAGRVVQVDMQADTITIDMLVGLPASAPPLSSLIYTVKLDRLDLLYLRPPDVPACTLCNRQPPRFSKMLCLVMSSHTGQVQHGFDACAV